MRTLWTWVKRFALWFDKFFEAFALTALAVMTLIVTVQVITRKLFNFVFHWSEEITLLLLIYYGFMGVAIGFREHLHIAMESFSKLLPKWFQRALDKIIPLSIILFGIFMVRYGWQFTQLMYPNKLPATEWSVSVQYAIMPISGVMTIIYGFLQLIGINTVRHKETEDELPE